MIVYLARAIQAFVMYGVNGTSRSSLLIESTDSMIVYIVRWICGIRQKEHNTNKKFVCRFLIRNMPHFYGLLLDLCGKHIATFFAKRAAIFANEPQFGETRHIFTGKVPQSQSLDCGALKDGALSGIASKCGAHRGISAVHGTPR